MNKKSISDILIERYIEDNCENSKLIDYKDVKEQEVYYYDELDNIEVKGFPFASDFCDGTKAINYEQYKALSKKEKDKYRLRFHYLSCKHELYIGTTGSGKTTTCMEPQIRALAKQKNKPNIFITDPKGEIFKHNAKYLKDNGYKVEILNFRDSSRSNTWNPLNDIYDLYMKINNVAEGGKEVKTSELDKSIILTDDIEKFGEKCRVYKGNAYKNRADYKSRLAVEAYLVKSEVNLLIKEFVNQLIPNTLKTNDETWNNGSRDLITGVILALVEEAAEKKEEFKKEQFNLKTVKEAIDLASKCNALNESENNYKRKMDKFLKGKSDEAIQKINNVLMCGDKTKSSYTSNTRTQIGKWMNANTYTLTMTTDIDLDDSEHPIAFFVSTRDYDSSDNNIVGLFLNWIYTKFLKKAEEKETKDGVSSARPLHFMLDEFANIPAIPDFENKIATARSRNMWFHLFLQSYEQLNTVYGGVAGVIIDNCQQQIFLGSQSYDSKQRFSKECGIKTTRINEVVNANFTKVIESMNVIPMSSLNSINPGTMYIKRINEDVIFSGFVRNYQCADEGIFKDFNDPFPERYAPYNGINPDEDKYKYTPVMADVLDDEEEEYENGHLLNPRRQK